MTKFERFKVWLAALFRTWADGLAPIPFVPPVVDPEPEYFSTPEYKAAFDLAYRWRDNRTVSGQYKRHQVYAELLDRFPETSRSILGLRLEQAVQALP